MKVRDLVQAIKSTTETFLGSDYHELMHVYEVDKNSSLEHSKGYGVIASDINLVEGNLGFNTIDQTFEVLLTSFYVSTNYGDLEKQDCVSEILDKAQELYDQLVKTKLGAANVVIIVNDMSVEIEELEEDKSVLARMSFNVKYRNSLR